MSAGFWKYRRPIKGRELAEAVGGPHDKLALRFDVLPNVCMFDGHVYKLRAQPIGGDESNCNYFYDYKGKAECPTTT